MKRNIRLFASYYFLACTVLILYIVLYPSIIRVDSLDIEQMSILAGMAVISTIVAWMYYPDKHNG
jgi:hypothetical protein